MSQSQNQIQVTNISGGGSPPTPISRNLTYAQLLTNISGSTLVTGETITITDFQIITYIQNSGAIGSEVIHYGSIEPMVARAISPNQLAPEIVSTVTPSDIINYEPIFTDRQYDAVNSGGITSTGVITYREDIQGVARQYDWRNVVFRRWETSSGSGVFDSITDTGFAFQDFSPYAGGTTNNTFIGSPLQLGSAFGTTYWLDNVVLQQFSAVSNVGIAYGCTFFGAFSNNSLGSMAFVTAYQEFQANTIRNVQNCTFTLQSNGNYGESWTGNVFNNLCNVNNVLQCTSNNIGQDFVLNICAKINSNTTTQRMVCNYVDVIQYNNLQDCNYNHGHQIEGNQDLSIVSNDCFIIFYNTGINIASSTINDNVADNISNNTIDFISQNVSSVITNNYSTASGSGTEISNNVVNIMQNNALADGALISSNVAGVSISSNTISVGISNNSFNTCTQNQNADITGNICYNILNNDCAIYNNQVASIVSNTGTIIQYNGGLSISNNSNIASIEYNSISFLDNNNFNNFDFQGNSGWGFTNNLVNGDKIKGCTNVSLDTCTINTRGISTNNFVTPLSSYTFSPTVNMAATTPSITTFDTTNGQVEQILTAGVLTYTPF